MTKVLHFRKLLATCSPPVIGRDVSIRHFAMRENEQAFQRDVALWLELRRVAWDVSSGKGRDWTAQDMFREFQVTRGWDARRLWLAFDEQQPGLVVGSVAASPGRLAGESVLNWLMVRPSCRRQGVARRLLVRLEQDCVARGGRIVWLETLSTWQSAIAFYESMGFTQGVHLGL